MATVVKPPTLVVLQLTGGNDPLNTVIPYGDPLYWDNRPTVRIPEQEILRIDNQYGFHPSMAALKPFWDEGKMAILLVEQFMDFALSVGNAFYVMETGAIVMQGAAGEFEAERAKEYLAI